MRKIVGSEFLSADGVMQAPDTWLFLFQTERSVNDDQKHQSSDE